MSTSQAFCKDWKSPRTGQIYKGCGEPITWMKMQDGKNVAYSQKDGAWIEHRLVCEARKQTTFVQQQQQQQQQEQQQQPMPNVGASEARDIATMQSDKLIEIQHEIGQVKRDQTSLIWLVQEIAKKLEVGYQRGEQTDGAQEEE